MRKPDACSTCVFSKHSTGFARDWVSILPPKIMVVMKMPSQDAVIKGQMGSDHASYYFWKDFILPMGLKKEEVTIVNVLRCYAPFPVGKIRKEAIESCKRWDSPIAEWKPDVIGISFSPSGLLKVPQQTRFLQRSIERAVEFTTHKLRPLLLLGDEAKEKFLPHLSGGMKAWQGSWFDYVSEQRTER